MESILMENLMERISREASGLSEFPLNWRWARLLNIFQILFLPPRISDLFRRRKRRIQEEQKKNSFYYIATFYYHSIKFH